MAQEISSTVARPTLAADPPAIRKKLALTDRGPATTRAARTIKNDKSVPGEPSTATATGTASQGTPSSSNAAAALMAQHTPAPAVWSNEDETGFQALLAKRKAAGYQRRGRDVSEQVLCRGTIKPNPDTVVATIVGIVAERAQVGRAELIVLMGQTTFPHPKAQPTDKGWCQGYVAGAIRNGFLVVEASTSSAGAV